MAVPDSKPKDTLGQPSYARPPKISKGQAFRRFLYNQETGQFLGRTPSSWGKIALFYVIFYAVLAALVAICFWVFLQTIDPRKPTRRLEDSIIGTSPGMGFRPMPPSANVESTLIWYKAVESSYLYWTKQLEKDTKAYLTPGSMPGRGANIHTCGFEKKPEPGTVCSVDSKLWQPSCTKENRFGYHKSSPCVFIKLNRIYGWVPEFYNDTENLPAKMPKRLKNHIRSISNINERNIVWISCEGENPADQENIGPIHVYPEKFQGFPGYYFPYLNSEGYLSPMIALHFERPRTGVLINVECKAWAKNIVHNRHEKQGSVHFELLID